MEETGKLSFSAREAEMSISAADISLNLRCRECGETADIAAERRRMLFTSCENRFYPVLPARA